MPACTQHVEPRLCTVHLEAGIRTNNNTKKSAARGSQAHCSQGRVLTVGRNGLPKVPKEDKMDSQKTAETVARIAQAAAQTLLAAQTRVTDQFAAGVILSAGTLESLIEAQAAAHLTAGLQTRWNRAGMQAIEAWLDDAADALIEGNVGGTSSAVQNTMEAAERKALQAAYKALSR